MGLQLRVGRCRSRARAAREAGLQPVYDTSARPGPDANDSRTSRITLSLDGSGVTIEVRGRADTPPELSELLAVLGRLQGSCPARE